VSQVARIHGETIVNRPPEVVFDFVADERNRYDPRFRHAELISPGPIGVGSRFRSESTSMGRPVEMIVEITAYERPRLLCSSTHLSLIDIHSNLSFEPVLGGTKLRWSSDLRPRGTLKVMTPVIGHLARRQTDAIWSGLKRTLESHDSRVEPR
jgi:hypothetical protein